MMGLIQLIKLSIILFQDYIMKGLQAFMKTTKNMFMSYDQPEASQLALGKKPTCQYRKCKRHRCNPWGWRSPGEGDGNPLKYSCLKNPVDRGAWWGTVHRVAKSQTPVKQLNIPSFRLLWTVIPFCTDKADSDGERISWFSKVNFSKVNLY